ncbi:TPA: phage tail tape measure protein [Klebsiella aerogenes]|nr:phage tail tape measure protein [Klebsiella aerogenes]
MASLRELIIKISANSQSFQTEIARASRMGADYYKTMQNGGRAATAASRESQRALQALNGQMTDVLTSAKALTGVMAGAFAASNLVQMADRYATLSAQIKLATTDSLDFAKAQKGLMDISQRTGSALADNSALFSRASSSLREWGYGTEDILKLTDTLANGLAVSGATAEETSSLIVQLSQALGRGVLRGQDFNSVAQSGGRIMKALADGLGVAQKELKGMADAGQLTTDKIVPALISQLETLKEEYNQIPTSVSQATTRVQNALMEWVGGTNQATGATSALAGVLSGAANNIDTLATGAMALVGVGLARYLGNTATEAVRSAAGLATAVKGEVAVAAAQVRGASIARQRATAAVYRAQQAVRAATTADAQAAAEVRLAAAQQAAARATEARAAAQARLNGLTSISSRLMTGALGLVGGIPGLLMIAAGAWYAVHQKTEAARQSALDYIKTLDEIKPKIKSMGISESAETETKIGAGVQALKQQYDAQLGVVQDYARRVATLEEAAASAQYTAYGLREDIERGLARARRELVIESDKLAQKQKEVTDAQNVGAQAADRTATAMAEAAGAVGSLAQQYEILNRVTRQTTFPASPKFGGMVLTGLNTEQQNAMDKLAREKVLATLKGAEKAKQQAIYAADDLGLPAGFREQYIAGSVQAYNDNEATNYKAPKTPKGPKTEGQKAEDQYTRLIKQQREQIALAGTSGELARMKYQIAEGELQTLTAQQKQVLLKNAALIDQKRTAEQLVNLENQLADSNANARAANDAQASGWGLGSRVRERAQELADIKREFEERERDLLHQRTAGDITEEQYTASLSLSRRYQAEREKDQKAHYKRLDAMRDDWAAGASEGLANWVDTASDYTTQVAETTENAIGGFVDTLADALNDNEASWKDWSISVLKSIEKVLINAAIVNSLKSLSSSGGAFGSFLSAIVPNADGGVYRSANLSAYSGQIVSSPTLFAFANGAGLMGEAGPEAIMPLTRAANGKLGVASVGGGGGGHYETNIEVHVDRSGNTDAQTGGNADAVGQAFAQTVSQSVQDGIRRELRPGGMIWAAQQSR